MITISPTISTININSHTYVHADWEANTPGTIGAIAQDIADQITGLDTVGTLTKTISGGVTLTSDESANLGFIFEGVLSAEAFINFAAGFKGIGHIENYTTGGFELSCGLVSGSRVVVPAGGAATIFCDGTRFITLAGLVRGAAFGTRVDFNLDVQGDAEVEGALAVAGLGTFGNLTVTGAGNFGNIDVSGNVGAYAGSFLGPITAIGDSTVTGKVTATANMECSSIIASAGGIIGGLVEIGGTTGSLHVHNSTGQSIIKIYPINPGFTAAIEFAVGAYPSPDLRWTVGKNLTAESGSDVGSDFFITRYTDDGTSLGEPIFIKRSNGHIIMSQLPTSASGLAAGTLWNNSGVLNVA